MTTVPATPDWLLRGEVGLCPCGCIGTRRKGSFVEKTTRGAAALLRRTLFSEDAAAGFSEDAAAGFSEPAAAGRSEDAGAGPGLLQRLDPRAKLLTLLGLLTVSAFVRHIPVLLGMYAITLVLAAASRLPLGFFVKRVWLFVPIFTGVVVLPATLNIVTHGHVVVPLGTWLGHRVGMTAQGLTAAGLVVARVATSISLVVLLTLTTPWARLLAALRALRAPRMLVLVIGMAYRYLFLLLTGVTDMYTARESRTVTRDTDVSSGRAFVSASAGALFGKAHALSEEVHLAMVSRGYSGNPRPITAFRLRVVDLEFAVFGLVTALTLLGADRALGR
jgi:cobalt/nickel transport system permease protein